MENKQKSNNKLFMSLIFILFGGLIFSPVGDSSVFAEEEDESEETEDGGNSGGFIIESEKVQGEMDVAGALTGEIKIEEGQIEGLTIIKTLDTGDERGPLVIRITSPGPIPVKNLEMNTVGGSPPELGGVCAPDKPDWVCLSDVKMLVEKQEADSISLPDAKIKTCFESECDALGETDENSDIESLMMKMEEQDLTLEEIMEGIEKDKETLKTIQELLEQAGEIDEKMQSDEQVEQIDAFIEEFKEVLNNVAQDEMEPKEKAEKEVEKATKEEKELDEETNNEEKELTDEEVDTADKAPLVVLTEELEKIYGPFDERSEEFAGLIEEAYTLIQELEESIDIKEKALAKIVAEKEEMDKEGKLKQAENYAALQDMAGDEKTKQASSETETNESEVNSPEIDTNGDEAESSKSKTSESDEEMAESETASDSEGTGDEEINIEKVEKALSELTEELESTKERAEELQEKADTLLEQKETISENINELKRTIEESEEWFDADVYKAIMESMLFMQPEKDEDEDGKDDEDITDDTDNGDTEDSTKEDSNANSEEDSNQSKDTNTDEHPNKEESAENDNTQTNENDTSSDEQEGEAKPNDKEDDDSS